ncbi:hypothetical protein CPB83DRAFT_851405 [Crepidotus variabilis]|uniref:Uncharacterized protein n=1 Tax=Crepidotus variabilis TaxID=179855 RepID=A0A9P6JRK5_9AGAR|nr:hypothetical protein CPB83DRAFT_851405 [Crepidotus variabilis]
MPRDRRFSFAEICHREDAKPHERSRNCRCHSSVAQPSWRSQYAWPPQPQPPTPSPPPIRLPPLSSLLRPPPSSLLLPPPSSPPLPPLRLRPPPPLIIPKHPTSEKRRKVNTGASTTEVLASFTTSQGHTLHNNASASSSNGPWTSTSQEPPSMTVFIGIPQTKKADTGKPEGEPAEAKPVQFKPVQILERTQELEERIKFGDWVDMMKDAKDTERRKAGGLLPGDDPFKVTVVDNSDSLPSSGPITLRWFTG